MFYSVVWCPGAIMLKRARLVADVESSPFGLNLKKRAKKDLKAMTTKPIATEIARLRGELVELEGHFTHWDRDAENIHGSKKYRSIARRIVLSSQRLEEVVKENTFSR
jgi:hypothetical protein